MIELCCRAAGQGLHDDVFMPRLFTNVEYEMLWRRERKKVRSLLDETLCGRHPDVGLRLLFESGVIAALLPEVCAMYDLGDGEGLHKDVWAHTIAVVSGVPPEVDLRWAALFHDIGKVRTRRINDGHVTFHNHDVVGSHMFDSLNARMNLFAGETALTRTVRYLILEHLRPAGYSDKWTDSAIRRLVTECGDVDFFKKLMSLSRADLTTKNPTKRRRCEMNADELEARVISIILNDNAPKLPKGTMGFIMKKVAAKPGPWLQAVREQLEAMLKAGILLPDQPVDYYVKAGISIVEQASETL